MEIRPILFYIRLDCPLGLWEYYVRDFILGYSFSCSNMPTNHTSFEWLGGTWKQKSYLTLYWSGIEIGILDIPKDNSSIKVFPNPTTGQLHITSTEQQVTGVEIFDIYGRALQTSKEVTLDISHLPTGIYFVKISTETGETVRKIVKE